MKSKNGLITLVSLLKRLLNHDLKEKLFKRMEKGKIVSPAEWYKATTEMIYAEVIVPEQYEFGAIVGVEMMTKFCNPVLIKKGDGLFLRVRQAVIPVSEGPFIAEVRCCPSRSGEDNGQQMYVETNSAGLLRGFVIDLQEIKKVEIINATGINDCPIIRFIMKPKIRWWNKDKWNKKQKQQKN